MQDYVTEADREVETSIRSMIAEHFPGDAIIGEEHGGAPGSSEFCWVIDPIDGTSSFVRGARDWVVALACTRDSQAHIAVTCHPLGQETFWAVRGHGCYVGERQVQAASAKRINQGVTGVGLSRRKSPAMSARLIGEVVARGGLFYHNGSGASMLAQVAAGRLIAFGEAHMNAWDCIGGLLLVKEAGGIAEESCTPQQLLEQGTRAICACPGVYDEFAAIAAPILT